MINIWIITLLDADYDTSKITLKWYVDGVEDSAKENQKVLLLIDLQIMQLIFILQKQ